MSTLQHLARICYTNLVSSSIITPSSEVTSLPASNIKNPMRKRVWKAAGTTNEYIDFDVGTGNTIRQIIGTDTNFSDSVQLTILASNNPAFTSAFTISGITYNSDFDIFEWQFSSPKSYRYWRLKIIDTGSGDTGVSLGTFFIGDYDEFDYRANITIDYIDPAIRTYSYDGQPITFTKTRYEVVNFNVQDVLNISELIDIVEQVGTSRMNIFLMLDPHSTMFNTSDGNYRFTWFGGFNSTSLEHIYQGVGNYAVTFEEAR